MSSDPDCNLLLSGDLSRVILDFSYTQVPLLGYSGKHQDKYDGMEEQSASLLAGVGFQMMGVQMSGPDTQSPFLPLQC